MCVTTYLLNNDAEKITIISTQGLHTLTIGRVDNDGNCNAVSTVLDLDQVAELYENLGDFIRLYEEKPDCDACHGAGRYWHNKETCITCGGSGKRS